MKTVKQRYLSHDINIRFKFVSILSFIFLLIAALSLIVSITQLSYVHAGINLFAILSSYMAHRTARSLQPQMSFYYFSIGFLVFSLGNSIFWGNEFFQTSFNSGLYILTMLMVINMFVSFVAAYKSYQIWLATSFSLIALLFYNIFQLSLVDAPGETNILLVNLKPLVFFAIIGGLLVYAYLLRKNINEHYKNRYKKEKKHVMKILAQIDMGYASFRIKYNSEKQPVNAKIEYYNQLFLEMLNLSHVTIDEAKLSDLNSDGKLIFENYKEFLYEFEKSKVLTRELVINEQSYHCSVFAIEHNHFGMLIKKD
ncbi:MAG: hypothetical protein K9I29_04515 [Bacteroidales bacterium]|nr:hypothetical protein [Bacteroidales bacterium]MCF8327535.1 hypothetical protein [Bacteroidales bacterium]